MTVIVRAEIVESRSESEFAAIITQGLQSQTVADIFRTDRLPLSATVVTVYDPTVLEPTNWKPTMDTPRGDPQATVCLLANGRILVTSVTPADYRAAQRATLAKATSAGDRVIDITREGLANAGIMRERASAALAAA